MLGIKDKNVNVYIVDDDKLVLKILSSKFISISKYNLKTYLNGEDFLEDFIKFPPSNKSINVLVLDYQLSSNLNKDAKNGNEILKFVKEINPKINVIMHSSNNDIEVASKAIELGARTFVKKNENSFLRINNQIKAVINENILENKKSYSRLTQFIFAGLLIVFVFLVLFEILTD
jgi:FixJ family two-component response regulator